VQEIKTFPYAPLSHPFVERLIGTIRRECLDRTLFWTTADLEMKLLDFQRNYNGDSQFVPLAGAVSWTVSNTDRRVTDRPADGRLFQISSCVQLLLALPSLR